MGVERVFSCAAVTPHRSPTYCLWAITTLVEIWCHLDGTLPAVGEQLPAEKVGSLKKSSYLYSFYRSLIPHLAFPAAALSTVMDLEQLARLAMITRLMIVTVIVFMITSFV